MLMILIYRLLYPLLLCLFAVLRPFNSKIQTGWKLRKNQPWLALPKHRKPIWFHCASGEFEYAKPVIRLLKTQYPKIPILVTYFSPSVEKSIANTPEVDLMTPTPWDCPKTWKTFLEHHQPQMLLVARTDLWPEMLWQARQNNIPRLLFSRTVNQNKSSFFHWINRPLLSLFTDIFCVSNLDVEFLNHHLPQTVPLHNAGDTRYDQCLYRIQHPKTLKNLNNFYRPLFLAASTWPEDEAWLIPLIKKNQIDTSFIIAPHEPSPEHLKKLQNELQTRGLKSSFYSKINSWDPREVLIIDQVGILADLYSWTLYSFVGGSVQRHVHSVMESLAHGNLTFVGPRHRNSREALLFQNEKIHGIPSVLPVTNPEDWVQQFENIKKMWNEQHKIELKLKLRSQAGASQRVLRWIENQMKV